MIFFELIGIFVCVLILETFFILVAVMLMRNGSPVDAELEDFVVPVLMLVIVLTFICTYYTYDDITTYNNEKTEVETNGN